MVLMNTYDLGNYVQHFNHLQNTGQLPSECYMFIIRQFFEDAECEKLVSTMISVTGAKQGRYRVFIENDEDWTTRVVSDEAEIIAGEEALVGKWMRIWDHTHRSMTDLTRVWSLLGFGKFEGQLFLNSTDVS